MPEETAYAHLGNAEQVLFLLLALDAGEEVVVPRSDLLAVLSRIGKARTIIHRTATTFKGD